MLNLFYHTTGEHYVVSIACWQEYMATERTVFMGQRALDVIHRSIRHATTIENLQPLACALRLCDRLDHILERCSILYSKAVGYEAFVDLPLRLSKPIA